MHDERNYLEECWKMLDGETLMIPELAHLRALNVFYTEALAKAVMEWR